MKIILICILSISLSSCINSYKHEFTGFNLLSEFKTDNGVNVNIKGRSDIIAIMPIWHDFPFLYFDEITNTNMLIRRNFSSYDDLACEPPPSFTVKRFLGINFTIGRKMVPSGYLILLNSAKILFIYQDDDFHKSYAYDLLRNTKFAMNLIKVLESTDTTIDISSIYKKCFWGYIINEGCPKLIFKLNKQEKEELIKTLKSLVSTPQSAGEQK